MSKQVTRLFEQFEPTNYKLSLVPDRDAMTFSGTVIITGKKKGRPSQRLTFHQKELNITKASIVNKTKQSDKDLAIDRINLHKSYDEVRLHTNEMVFPGEYEITLEFSGKITKPMNGMYPCFFEENKKQKVLIATQFESHHAREVFPCIDEPEAKATFDLTLTTPKGETVLADTPAKSHKDDGKLTTTTFETTPKMSTYLLAFVYGDLKFKEAKTANGTLVRTYATPNNVDFTDFALDVAVKTLDFYNDYFGQPYPLEKCDLIALPDFASGAMENWGCITFREQCMLVDPANTSIGTKQYVAMVVAHELAHQWFGNLVTMRWWTDLWLNEGFASWIEYLAVDHLFPEWNMWTQYVVDEQQGAFRLDALENTHPIEVEVKHPDEIRTIFDNISYAKGSSVIHMLNQYLTPDVFRDGLRHYLKKHAYGNTDTTDLWASLSEVSKKNVTKFMSAWTSLPGFPLVTATVTDNTVSLSQNRFVISGKNSSSEKWPVPLLANDPKLATEALEAKSGKFTFETDQPLLLNSGRSGFYRTVYDPEHLKKLTTLIQSGQLDIVDRLGLLSDMFEAVKAGQASTTDALSLLSAYENEDNAVVWDIIASVIGEIRGVMDDDELRETMKPYVRKLVNHQLERLGWEKKDGEPYFDTLLRPTILGMASAADEPSVVTTAQTRFVEMKTPEDIDPDLRGVIYTTVARNGGKAEFDRLLKLHNESTNSEERTTICAALTNFKQPELVSKSLTLVISDDVRHQDIGYWVAYSFMNRYAREKTWSWLKKEWGWLEKNLGSDLSFSRFPVYAGRSFSDRKFLADYNKFFKSIMSPTLERSVKQGAEMIEWHADWKNRDFKALLAYFKALSQ